MVRPHSPAALSGRVAAVLGWSSVRDPFETPWLVVIAMFALPFVVAVFCGIMVFRGMPPLVYRCRRCEREFHRAAHRRFPAVCPLCRARDWNA